MQEGAIVRLRQGEQGAAVVEFALVLPILMMFLFGIVEFGRGYSARIELTSGVREGVRIAALWTGVCAPPATAPVNDLQQCVLRTVQDGAQGLSRSDITVDTVARCPTDSAVDSNVTVRATYPFRYEIPFVGTRGMFLTAKGVMRCRG